MKDKLKQRFEEILAKITCYSIEHLRKNNGDIYTVDAIQSMKQVYNIALEGNWVNSETPPENSNPVWALHKTLGGEKLIPMVVQYSDGTNLFAEIEEGEGIAALAKGFYEDCEQTSGEYEQVFIYKENIVFWQPIHLPLPKSPISK